MLFETALAGQVAVLGPLHARTLRTKYELAVALKFTGESDRSVRLLREIRQAAPHLVGLAGDLYMQSVIAAVLLRLPTGIVRTISPLGHLRLAIGRPTRGTAAEVPGPQAAGAGTGAQ